MFNLNLKEMKKFMKRITSGVTKMTGKINKKATLFIAAVALSFSSMAQGFNEGISQATSEFDGTFDLISQLMLIIGGIIGVVGAIRIYIKWNNGDQDVTKSIIAWAGAALFLVISSVVLRAIFNIA